jgi:hypothetical protein
MMSRRAVRLSLTGTGFVGGFQIIATFVSMDGRFHFKRKLGTYGVRTGRIPDDDQFRRMLLRLARLHMVDLY